MSIAKRVSIRLGDVARVTLCSPGVSGAWGRLALVRVFISSVRGGLEAERDALPGLVKAIGHEPVRFEDFTAQPDPSRQACMDGVDSSDAYLLLLGPRYGHTFPDTGQSPTHDEYMRARARGIPKLVFLKEGPTPEPEQAKLIEQIRDYASGSFYDTFSGVADLLEKAAQAIRGLESGPSALTWEPLPDPPDFSWRSDWADPRQGQSRDDPIVELHAMPLPSTPIPGRSFPRATNGSSTGFANPGRWLLTPVSSPRSPIPA